VAQTNSCAALLSKAALPEGMVGVGLGINHAAMSFGDALGPIVSGALYSAAQHASPQLPPALAQGRAFFVAGAMLALCANGLACGL